MTLLVILAVCIAFLAIVDNARQHLDARLLRQQVADKDRIALAAFTALEQGGDVLLRQGGFITRIPAADVGADLRRFYAHVSE